ncbi:GAF domain-containing protein [Blastomonas sp.]|uniref:GAF domain-containing protein n=1 Tax=Blastomonas sp. TaxID=1909299 RepID=UPI0035934BB1
MIGHKLSDEPARLASLQRYDVLETPADAILEKVTALVSRVLKVPIAALSLVDSDRQWFKSVHGMDAREMPRSISFCAHAIKSVSPLVIPDVRRNRCVFASQSEQSIGAEIIRLAEARAPGSRSDPK